jgi:hypothetical protein
MHNLPPIKVHLPNNQIIHSTANRQLNIPHVTTHGQLAQVFPDLKSGNLLSLGQILDDNHHNVATFTHNKVTIQQDSNIIATGHRNRTTQGMWHIHLPMPHHINLILHKQTTKTQLACFLHAA